MAGQKHLTRESAKWFPSVHRIVDEQERDDRTPSEIMRAALLETGASEETLRVFEEITQQRGIEALRRAVWDSGPYPRLHFETMERHKKEWPTLWQAIETLVDGPASEDGVSKPCPETG